jgi:hypothetical protein
MQIFIRKTAKKYKQHEAVDNVMEFIKEEEEREGKERENKTS